MNGNYSRSFRGREITAVLQGFGCGLQVTVTGGDLSHVGAVCIADRGGFIQTIELPGHRESVIAEKWAKRLCGILGVPVVATVGVHYEDLSQEGVRQVLACCDEILEECSARLLKEN